MNDSINIGLNKIDELFLIESIEEYESIAVDGNDSSNHTVLSIQSEPPFFMDKINDPRVSSWQKFGVIDFPFSRYWLDNYKEIESLCVDSVRNINESLLLNEYLMMDYVWNLGSKYIEPVVEFDSFLSKYKPNMICVNNNSTVTNFIKYFADKHGFVLKGLSR